MNTPQPVSSKPTDNTLTLKPHIVGVAVGWLSGFLLTKVGLPASVVTPVCIGAASALTSFIHWGMAKLAQ
jgi:hypothetical protein